MKIIPSSRRHRYLIRVSVFLIAVALIAGMVGGAKAAPLEHPYACEEDLIEIMFAQDSQVRLRHGALVDLATNALAGVDDILQELAWFEWYRICDVPEERLDEIQAHGEANTGEPVYNLNNIYRLRIPMGLDVWAISEELEALSGVMLARPVPKPMPLPQPPPNYVPNQDGPNQGYLRPASSTPAGIDADYAWNQTGGNGAGVTVCDLEYFWNYNHPDITNAVGSQTQINPNPISNPGQDANHGTAVIGVLVSEDNGRGTTGICYGASLRTCGTYYFHYSPYYNLSLDWWDPAGAITYAIDNLKAGDVILLEQQWDYYQQWDPDERRWIPSDRNIPIEWLYSNYYDSRYQLQSENSVYATIKAAIAVGIHVVEAGGNGDVDTRELPWAGDSGAIIVGAGGNLERLSFLNWWGSSYGPRFNLQGWGEDVVTTGYGDLYPRDEGANYTNTFGGTSSASAIVAGAVAVVQGNRLALGLPILWPGEMRSLLVATGTAQNLSSVAGNIGPLPNLAQALPASTSTPYRLTIGVSAGGSVTVAPYGPWYDPLVPGPGQVYAPDTVVNLTATPAAGYRFVNWTGNIGTIANVNAANTTITMNDDYSITANFEEEPSVCGCFIATAAYGTPMAEEIQIMREFRDKYLLTNPVGQALVDFYYRVSPPIAEFITEHPSLKPIVRAGLVPAVAMSTVAVNTTPAEKIAIIGLLALVSVAVAIWATRRRGRGPQYT